ncbi:LCP family protein [Actinomadura sp. WMMA1423]|uniref:LCP family protein n=1 Tax=Actinomadura sp. WMMA1423 TaxID=2591108 RepID=UPI00114692A3|nr:LCP family protein [Actinomadura sp. WMMA1423]
MRSIKGAARAAGAGRGRRRLLLPLDILVVLLVAAYFLSDAGLRRVDALEAWKDRPRDTPAQDWLLVGVGATGGAGPEAGPAPAAPGRRADVIALLHIPARTGRPTLVLLPPDLSVGVPGAGRGRRALGMVYSAGGRPALTRTVESLSWLHIDRYLELDLAGLVDAVGGVRVCAGEPNGTPKARLVSGPACGTLGGPRALAYIRGAGTGEPDRIARQRALVVALADRATSPRTLLDPFRGAPLLWNEARLATAGRGDRLHHLIRLATVLHGVPDRVVVATLPVVGLLPGSDGLLAVWQWEGTRALFSALQADRPVPRNLRVE